MANAVWTTTGADDFAPAQHDCSRAEPAASVDAREMLAKDEHQAGRTGLL
jgi:hypothetical protein